MPFCAQCGNELSAGVRFCGKCGKDQLMSQNQCPKCGKELEDNEKFCSGCGTPVAEKVEPKTVNPKQIPPEPKEEKFTKEGRKIISGGPKPDQNKQVTPPPPPIAGVQTKKKKKGCRGCAITSILILAVLIVVTMLVYNRVSDWWHNYKVEQGFEKLDTEGVDGIVDIEEGDVSHLPENRTKKQNQTQSASSTYEAGKSIKTKEIKEACNTVEKAFENADIEQVKSLLTEQGKLNYANLLDDIQPYMKDYAKAFKNRKLVASDKYFAIYSFKDNEGNEYTVEFALNDSGEWKLVRF